MASEMTAPCAMFTTAGWACAAGSYADTAGHITSPFCNVAATMAFDRIVEKTDLPACPQILDIATGTGEAVFHLREKLAAANRTAAITATDISQHMIDEVDKTLARGNKDAAKAITVKTQVEDAATLDGIASESVDVAMCTFGIMFVPEPEAALKALMRVLKPKGTAVFTTWHYVSLTDIFEVAARDQAKTLSGSPLALNFKQEGYLRSLFTTAGLTVASVSFPQRVIMLSVDAVVEAFLTNPVFAGHEWDLEAMKTTVRGYADETGDVKIRATAVALQLEKP